MAGELVRARPAFAFPSATLQARPAAPPVADHWHTQVHTFRGAATTMPARSAPVPAPPGGVARVPMGCRCGNRAPA